MLDLHRCDPVKGTEMHFSVSKTTKLLFCTDKRSGLSAWRLQHAVYPLAYLDVGCQPEFSFYFQNQPPFLEMISLKRLAEPACTFPCKTYTPLQTSAWATDIAARERVERFPAYHDYVDKYICIYYVCWTGSQNLNHIYDRYHLLYTIPVMFHQKWSGWAAERLPVCCDIAVVVWKERSLLQVQPFIFAVKLGKLRKWNGPREEQGKNFSNGKEEFLKK